MFVFVSVSCVSAHLCVRACVRPGVSECVSVSVSVCVCECVSNCARVYACAHVRFSFAFLSESISARLFVFKVCVRVERLCVCASRLGGPSRGTDRRD